MTYLVIELPRKLASPRIQPIRLDEVAVPKPLPVHPLCHVGELIGSRESAREAATAQPLLRSHSL